MQSTHCSARRSSEGRPVDTDALAQAYLGRLEAAASALAVDRRAELVVEVREHIAAAVAEAGRSDESTIRNILERLGPPEEIVAAERLSDSGASPGSASPSASPSEARTPWGPVEIIALLLLTVGALVLPLVGPIVGLVLVWLSTRWTNRQKSIVTAIVVVLLVVPVLGLLSVSGR